MPPKSHVTRREFLISTAFAGASYALVSQSLSFPAGILAANERLRVGLVGVGRAGMQHLAEFALTRNVEISALCDVNESRLRRTSAQISSAGLRQPDLFTDFRRLLDRRDIDAVSIAVPRKVRASLAIQACESGKDVLIEKPFCFGLQEGRELELTAERTQRVVQQVNDTPLFSAPELLTMLTARGSTDVLRISGLQHLQGEFELAHESRAGTPAAIEQSLDVLELARSVIGVRFPVSVSAAGGGAKNSHSFATVNFAFLGDSGTTKKIRLETRVSRAATGRAQPDRSRQNCGYPDWLGTSGVKRLVGTTSLTFVMPQVKFTVDSEQGDSSDYVSSNTWANFVSCVKERNFAGLHNPIQEARISSALVKLAEVSLILGRGFSFNPDKEKAGDEEVDLLIQ